MHKDLLDIDRRRFLVTTGALGGSALIAGCGGVNTTNQTNDTPGDGNEQSTQTGSKTGDGTGGTFIGATAEEAPTLDPRMNELAWANSFLFYVFDTLLMIHPNGERFVPHLAVEQPTKEDETTFVFTLREGVTFHDGEELTAEDVAYSINWILDPKNKSTNRANLSFIDTVETVSKYEAQFNLKYPFALFEQALSSMNAPIVPKHIAEKQGTETFGQQPVGSGPFSFVEQTAGSHITLERFDDYFLKTPKLAEYRMRIIPKAQVQFVELVTGGVHTASIPKTLLKKAKQESGIEMKNITQLDYNGLIFNALHEPLNDRTVRRAMQYLVDYDELLKATKGTLGTRSYGFLPMPVNEAWNFPWNEWKEKYYPDRNHEKAKQLLEEAGYGDGFGEPLHISSLSGEEFKNMAIILQNELNQIGIEADVSEVTTGQWLNQLDTGDFDVTIYGWNGVLDPDDSFYYLFRDLHNDPGELAKDNPGNASAAFLYAATDANTERGQQLAAVDRKIRNARKELNHDTRREMYIEIAEFWQSQYPHISVYSEKSAVGWRTEVQDYEPTTFSNQLLCNEWHNVSLSGT